MEGRGFVGDEGGREGGKAEGGKKGSRKEDCRQEGQPTTSREERCRCEMRPACGAPSHHNCTSMVLPSRRQNNDCRADRIRPGGRWLEFRGGTKAVLTHWQ